MAFFRENNNNPSCNTNYNNNNYGINNEFTNDQGYNNHTVSHTNHNNNGLRNNNNGSFNFNNNTNMNTVSLQPPSTFVFPNNQKTDQQKQSQIMDRLQRECLRKSKSINSILHRNSNPSNNYKIGHELSKTATASNNIVYCIKSGHFRMMKRSKISFRDKNVENKIKYISNEFALPQNLRHENISRAIEIYIYENEIAAIYTLYDRDSLQFTQELIKIVDNKVDFRKINTNIICLEAGKQLTAALAYCHGLHIFWRDIKWANICLYFDYTKARFKWIIIDGGWCTKSADGYATTSAGTRGLMAPEIKSQEIYDAGKADVWSLGVVISVWLSLINPLHIDHLPKLFLNGCLHKRECKSLNYKNNMLPLKIDCLDPQYIINNFFNINPMERASMTKLATDFKKCRKEIIAKTIGKQKYYNLYNEGINSILNGCGSTNTFKTKCDFAGSTLNEAGNQIQNYMKFKNIHNVNQMNDNDFNEVQKCPLIRSSLKLMEQNPTFRSPPINKTACDKNSNNQNNSNNNIIHTLWNKFMNKFN